MKDKTVLIVEDDHSIRELLQELLQVEGYETATASNGSDALQRIEQGLRPNLIILDLMMPILNGWDFLKELRAGRHCAMVPVIAVSATRDLGEVIGASAVLCKPIEIESLMNLVKHWCDK